MTARCVRLLALMILCMLPPLSPARAAAAAADALQTEAEAAGYLRTGRYDEVIRLCPAYAAAFPGRVRCLRFGTSPEGRPLLALAASADGALDPAEVRRRGRPVVLLQGGIHAGEIEGKDAGLILLRDLSRGRALPGALSAVTVLLVPVFNVDGHERFGPNHRPNQRGPQQMGMRATGQNLNLNRDYVKAEAPEMAAMLRLMRDWDPILVADLHTTDGAQFQHDVAVIVEPQLSGAATLRPVGAALSAALQQALSRAGHLPLPFYPSFEVDDEPTSGFEHGVAPPRFSYGYLPLRNRLGVLVEAHSWRTYPERVRVTRDVLVALLQRAVADGLAWLRAARAADQADASAGGREVALRYDVDRSKSAQRLRFQGYAYVRERSPVSGAMRIRYDERRPQVWDVPLYTADRPEVSARAPRAGYVVAAAHAGWVAQKLRLHGLSYQVLAAAERAPVEVFRVTGHHLRPEPYEGRQVMDSVEGAWRAEVRELPAGSLYVPVGQPGADLVVHLFEPRGPDSLLSWGFFNAALEQKEYMEAYVTEAEAERMLAQDAALRAAFERRLRDAPEFARDPAARLRYFYERHPAFDDRQGLYPVMRVTQAPRSATAGSADVAPGGQP